MNCEEEIEREREGREKSIDKEDENYLAYIKFLVCKEANRK